MKTTTTTTFQETKRQYDAICKYILAGNELNSLDAFIFFDIHQQVKENIDVLNERVKILVIDGIYKNNILKR